MAREREYDDDDDIAPGSPPQRPTKPRSRDDDDDDDDDDRPIRKGKMKRSDLRSVAIYQKAILLCILLYICVAGARFLMPPEIQLLVSLALVPVAITSTVFVFLLATKTYGTGLGIVLGILTLIPCVGLIVLLIVNGRATSTLREHGIQVGLLGARLSDLN